MDPRDAGPGDGPVEPSPDTPWSREGREEAEPEWAQQIREGRKARGERLRALLSSPDESGSDPAEFPLPSPEEQGQDRGPYDREAE